VLLRRYGDLAHPAPDRAVVIADRGAEQIGERDQGHGTEYRGQTTESSADCDSGDLRWSRAVSIGTQRLEFMIEGFNLLNHVNILAVNNVYGTGAVPNAAFGQPTLAGDPRQMQAGVRWTF
jgi:hypothetical protein